MNLTMLLATIPIYEPVKDDSDGKGKKSKKEPEELKTVESLQDLSSFIKIPRKKK